jgi:hypothetical protein
MAGDEENSRSGKGAGKIHRGTAGRDTDAAEYSPRLQRASRGARGDGDGDGDGGEPPVRSPAGNIPREVLARFSRGRLNFPRSPSSLDSSSPLRTSLPPPAPRSPIRFLPWRSEERRGRSVAAENRVRKRARNRWLMNSP